MKLDTHGNNNGLNDLYVLPETKGELKKVKSYLSKTNKRSFTIEKSNIPSQDWYKKTFFNISFGENLIEDFKKMNEIIFDYETVTKEYEAIKEGIKAPYIDGYSSSLGGKDRVSILITISLDHKDTWINGIRENSSYMNFHIDRDGTIEQFTKHYKINKNFRKRKCKSIQDIIIKINEYIEIVKNECK